MLRPETLSDERDFLFLPDVVRLRMPVILWPLRKGSEQMIYLCANKSPKSIFRPGTRPLRAPVCDGRRDAFMRRTAPEERTAQEWETRDENQA